MSTALEVRGITRRFGEVMALDDVSFRLDRGEICGFVGPNGAGKTTTLRICATLDLPDSGTLWIDERPVLQDPDWARQRIGFLPDDWLPPPHTLVREHLDFHARTRHPTRSLRQRAVDEAVALTGLGALLEKECTGLSRGMRQRVGLASILMHRPHVLLLDEPASGLDPRARVDLRRILQTIAARGCAILLSSHILSELDELCSAVVILERGRLQASGPLAAIRRQVMRDPLYRLRALCEVDKLLDFLVNQPGVSLVGPDQIRLAGGEGAAAALLAAAVAAGLMPTELALIEEDLEAVFLALTRGEVQ